MSKPSANRYPNSPAQEAARWLRDSPTPLRRELKVEWAVDGEVEARAIIVPIVSGVSTVSRVIGSGLVKNDRDPSSVAKSGRSAS